MDSVTELYRILLMLCFLNGILCQIPCEIESNKVVTLCYNDTIILSSSSPGYSYIRGIAFQKNCHCTMTSATQGTQSVQVTVSPGHQPCNSQTTFYFVNNKETSIVYCNVQPGTTTSLTLEAGVTTRINAVVHTDSMCLKIETTMPGEITIQCDGSETPPPITGTAPPAETNMTRTTTPRATTTKATTTHITGTVPPTDTNMTRTTTPRATTTPKATTTTPDMRTSKLPTQKMSTPKAEQTTSKAIVSTSHVTSQTQISTAAVTTQNVQTQMSQTVTEPGTEAQTTPNSTMMQNQTTLDNGDDDNSGNIWHNNKEKIIAGVVCAGIIIGLSLIVYCLRKCTKRKEEEKKVEHRRLDMGRLGSSTIPSMITMDNPIYDHTDDRSFDTNINYKYFTMGYNEMDVEMGKSDLFNEPEPNEDIHMPHAQNEPDSSGVTSAQIEPDDDEVNTENGEDSFVMAKGDRPAVADVNADHSQGHASSGDSGQDSDNIEMVVTNMNTLVDNQRHSIGSDNSN